MIPYGRQQVDDDDIRAVVDALRSDWLTTGPAVERFEEELASKVSAAHGVAVSSGTAALHVAALALRVGPGDEVIVPPLTFAATANAFAHTGAKPVFVDVRAGDLLIDPEHVEEAITDRTAAIVGVDYAGHPCDWDALRDIAQRHGVALVDDGCHALGAVFRGRPVGSLADLTVFSFHPVKHITTGEGGMVVTDDAALAGRMRMFRNHGITSDFRQREATGRWYYEIDELGNNYRITDFQCALGSSQLGKLDGRIARRVEIAARYDAAFAGSASVTPLRVAEDVRHAYHLYVVKLADSVDRAVVFDRMRAAGIGVNVHYVPVHLHPYYRRTQGTHPGLCPVAEEAYEHILSLPMFPGLTDDQVDTVAETLKSIVSET